jgi:hypothetical protein
MAANCTPIASIRYDLFEEISPETISPSTSPEQDKPRIHISLMRENPTTHNLAALNSRSVRQLTSINPLHFNEASYQRSPSCKPGQPNRSLSDIYRDSVKCMNKIIKEALPKGKNEAQALFAAAEKVQVLLPQHRDKIVSALQAAT